MNEHKPPLRKCIACQVRKPKHELIRVVNNPEQGLMIDERGKLNGRGAYLCRDRACIEKARKKNLLKVALKTSINDEFYEEILRYVVE